MLGMNMKLYSEEQERFWGKQISEYENKYKHLSLRDFCDVQKVSYSKLIYWRKRLSERVLPRGKAEKVSFMPVKLSDSEEAEKSVIELYYKKDYCLVIPVDIEESCLNRFLIALESAHANAAVRD